MKHYISICSDRFASTAKKIDLFEWSVLAAQPNYAKDKKEDSMLVFNGYSNDEETSYPRQERHLTNASSFFIDCDNPNSDPNIIDKWRKRMKDYDWMIYETASSTKDCPKFRAIVPLDSEIPWNKYTKNAIFQLFSDFADPKASWFFAPTLNKLPTVEENTTGKWMPADGILSKANNLRLQEQMEASLMTLKQMKWQTNNDSRHEGNWRNLPSVKKCLEGLHVGERDNALCAACYAMDKNGYRNAIPQFLDEVVCDMAIKNKFRHRYR